MTNLSKLLITTSLITSTSLLAQTTMCFKKDVQDLTQLENIKLNGGECKSAYSLNDMKKDGWEVSDIKINNNDYIYILKKGSAISWNGTSTDTEAMEERLLKKMEEKRKKEIEQKKIIELNTSIEKGKTLYVSKCQSCHGANANEEPSFSRSLLSINKDDFIYAINNYRNGTYDRGSGMVMKPYAFAISKNEINDVYNYLETLKK